MNILRILFFYLFIRPVTFIMLGRNVKGITNLPKQGPAVLIANHNSHLDTIVLMSLFSCKTFLKIRPLAAADYFLKNRVLAWFSQKIMGIIPISRNSKKCLFEPITQSLKRREILILFPEGSRGKPEELTTFKAGAGKIGELHPDVPFTPIFLYGLGKALPKGEALLVPFIVDINVGKPLTYTSGRKQFITEMEDALQTLKEGIHIPEWD